MVNLRAFNIGQLCVEFEGETAVIHGPASGAAEVEIDSNEDVLRTWVRQDGNGSYRPLPGATTMRSGWRVRCTAGLSLAAAIEAVYPLAMLHTEQQRAGALKVVALQSVLERQTGRYARAVTLSEDGRKVAAGVLCGRCVKRPVWRGDEVKEDSIPCPEPCSVLVSLCRDAALWEVSRPQETVVDPGVPWAAFERSGNAIREQYLRKRFESSNPVGLSDG